MQRYARLAMTVAGMMLASQPVLACRVNNDLNLPDVKNADVAVIGRISDYKVIGENGHYAQFSIQVDEILVGNVGKNLVVRWYNSTFALPEKMNEGPFLIALRAVSPDMMTVLQAPCSSPFIFEIASDEARIARGILALNRK